MSSSGDRRVVPLAVQGQRLYRTTVLGDTLRAAFQDFQQELQVQQQRERELAASAKAATKDARAAAAKAAKEVAAATDQHVGVHDGDATAVMIVDEPEEADDIRDDTGTDDDVAALRLRNNSDRRLLEKCLDKLEIATCVTFSKLKNEDAGEYVGWLMMLLLLLINAGACMYVCARVCMCVCLRPHDCPAYLPTYLPTYLPPGYLPAPCLPACPGETSGVGWKARFKSFPTTTARGKSTSMTPPWCSLVVRGCCRNQALARALVEVATAITRRCSSSLRFANERNRVGVTQAKPS